MIVGLLYLYTARNPATDQITPHSETLLERNSWNSSASQLNDLANKLGSHDSRYIGSVLPLLWMLHCKNKEPESDLFPLIENTKTSLFVLKTAQSVLNTCPDSSSLEMFGVTGVNALECSTQVNALLSCLLLTAAVERREVLIKGTND